MLWSRLSLVSLLRLPNKANLRLISSKSASSSALLPGGIIRWNSEAPCAPWFLSLDVVLLLCNRTTFQDVPRVHKRDCSTCWSGPVTPSHRRTMFRAPVGRCGSRNTCIDEEAIWWFDYGGDTPAERCLIDIDIDWIDWKGLNSERQVSLIEVFLF